MVILFSDTSVLADLGRALCLDACFRLPDLQFVVSDLLYKRELAATEGPNLCKLGLRAESLTGAEVASAQAVRRAHPKLSLPDAYAYTLARSRTWTLLAGDGELLGIARQHKLDTHSAAWLFDLLFDGQFASAQTLTAGLAALAAHPLCRVPKTELHARAARFAGARR